jgi:hypothetical protein
MFTWVLKAVLWNKVLLSYVRRPDRRGFIVHALLHRAREGRCVKRTKSGSSRLVQPRAGNAAYRESIALCAALLNGAENSQGFLKLHRLIAVNKRTQ